MHSSVIFGDVCVLVFCNMILCVLCFRFFVGEELVLELVEDETVGCRDLFCFPDFLSSSSVSSLLVVVSKN